jgi:hypothetical protein
MNAGRFPRHAPYVDVLRFMLANRLEIATNAMALGEYCQMTQIVPSRTSQTHMHRGHCSLPLQSTHDEETMDIPAKFRVLAPLHGKVPTDVFEHDQKICPSLGQQPNHDECIILECIH